jgi:hypothetical protein
MNQTFEKVKNDLEAAVSKMVEAAEAFPWSNKKAYADLIAQTYFYSRHTTRILGLAGVHFPFSQSQLHYRFLRHAAEETGHERLTTKDLKTLGFGLENFSESPATMALYQTQYYWIQHVEPAAIYGYILALEGFSAHHCRKMYETCKALYGADASLFWKVHSEDDPDHIEKALFYVEQLPEATLQNIRVNTLQTAAYYSEIYHEIIRRTADVAQKNVKPVYSELLLKSA